jgi:hypothetical protein
MKHLFIFLFFCLSLSVFAQEDLMSMLDDGTKEDAPVSATFKAVRIINGHSIETTRKNHLDFVINHRFGALNSGYQNFWGLDQAQIRLGLEYGVSKNLMVGIGRSSHQKVIDMYFKYRLLTQTESGSMPVSLGLFASNAITTLQSPNYNDGINRYAYTYQALLARKFSESISVQLTPTLIHRNLVQEKSDQNTLFSMGIGGRCKLTKRTSVNFEYFWVPERGNQVVFRPMFSLGFDIETGGHVFQLHFTNSLGMIEKAFIAETVGRWGKGDVLYGFNISRTFSLNRK